MRDCVKINCRNTIIFLAVLNLAEQTDSSAFSLVDTSFENSFLQNEKHN